MSPQPTLPKTLSEAVRTSTSDRAVQAALRSILAKAVTLMDAKRACASCGHRWHWLTPVPPPGGGNTRDGRTPYTQEPRSERPAWQTQDIAVCWTCLRRFMTWAQARQVPEERQERLAYLVWAGYSVVTRRGKLSRLAQG